MDVESPDSRLGGSHSFDGADANDGTRPMAAGNDEPGPKLGDNHQAVIPTLSTLTRSGELPVCACEKGRCLRCCGGRWRSLFVLIIC